METPKAVCSRGKAPTTHTGPSSLMLSGSPASHSGTAENEDGGSPASGSALEGPQRMAEVSINTDMVEAPHWDSSTGSGLERREAPACLSLPP